MASALAERFVQYKEQVDSLTVELCWYRTAVDLCPLPMLLVHNDGGLIYANEAYLELVEDSLESVQGLGWSHVIHPDDRERVTREWSDIVSDRHKEWSATFKIIRQRCGHALIVLAKVVKTHYGYYIGILVPSMKCSMSEDMGSECLVNWLNHAFTRPSHTPSAAGQTPG